ncbi:Pentatricopeptide repeat-containing protein [Striga hermonthica]|uniref:Pentatricopeptide repeat-containing protein n=1 Tax=Striga hermonthica TaxID=68872 RepID=A0A9N7RC02_STRHE|nr:Pentatricopeptide repeat-containing protein [Striga hermonthica]
MQPTAPGRVSKRSLSQLLSNRPPISRIKQIHARVITEPLDSPRVSLIDSLIHCYLHAGDLSSGRALFDGYPSPPPSALLWNLLIRAYSKIPRSSEPITLFRKMLGTRTAPDKYTFNFVITSCAHQEEVVHGRIFHGFVVKNGSLLNMYVANSLINLYSVFARSNDARKVFDDMPERDVFAWTSLVSAYAKNGDMKRAGEVFREMPVRNDVSWAVMVSGFASSGCYAEAIKYFRDMLRGVRPNEAALVCALSACANLGSLDQGSWIHDYIDKNRISRTSNIMTALIDMYAKCGKIDRAFEVFDKIPKRDAQNFTSMISGLSIHGLGEKAIRIFQRMLTEKLKPNEITILGVLNGCSHSGLLQQGSSIFYNMESLWGIVPKIGHYGCYIDLLGRAGHLAKAFGIVKSMPVKPDIAVWRSLLSSCRIHRDSNFGERVIGHLDYLEPRNCSGANVLLSNMYASLGKWEKVVQVRDTMGKLQKNQSDIGVSWLEFNGVVHEFRVADKLHPQIEEIRKKLSEIMQRVRSVGYAADVTQVSFDLNDEDRENAVTWHSEKLAVTFALMNTRPMDSIRIVKNLRTCEDCHVALKAISRVYDREIIVRDRSRFHTFREGKCSCRDYW